MTVRFEVMGYQPAVANTAQSILFQEEWNDEKVVEGELINTNISAGVADDQRPVMFAIRNIGDDIPVTMDSCTVAMTFKVVEQVASEQGQPDTWSSRTDTKLITFNPQTIMPTGNRLWHQFLITVDDTKEISRVQVWWGPYPEPE